MATKAEIESVVRAEISRAMQWLIAGKANAVYDPTDPDYAWCDDGPTMKGLQEHLQRLGQYLAAGQSNNLFNPDRLPWMADAVTLPDVKEAVDA